MSQRTKSEQRKIARKGGVASGKSRRKKADLRDLAQTWLQNDCGVSDKNGKPMTGAELVIKTAVKEMVKGSIQHMIFIRDTAGYKPVDKVMIADITPSVIAEVEALVNEYTCEDANSSGGG